MHGLKFYTTNKGFCFTYTINRFAVLPVEWLPWLHGLEWLGVRTGDCKHKWLSNRNTVGEWDRILWPHCTYFIYSRQSSTLQQPDVEFVFSTPKHSSEELTQEPSLSQDSIAMQPLPALPTVTKDQVTDEASCSNCFQVHDAFLCYYVFCVHIHVGHLIWLNTWMPSILSRREVFTLELPIHWRLRSVLYWCKCSVYSNVCLTLICRYVYTEPNMVKRVSDHVSLDCTCDAASFVRC